jgi:hypothetical protein
MNVHSLLAKLQMKRHALDLAISEIELALQGIHIRYKANDILDTIKPLKRKYARKLKVKAGTKVGYKYKPGTHWMQKPENRARVQAIARKMHKVKRAKS